MNIQTYLVTHTHNFGNLYINSRIVAHNEIKVKFHDNQAYFDNELSKNYFSNF